ncbi:MAG: AAA family ATPase, partial [Nanoarchaeota archaeon]
VKVEEELQELEKFKYQKELKKQMLIDERKELINEIEKIKEEPLFIENIEEELKLIMNELSQLKNINFGAIEKFKEVEKEYNELEEKVKKTEEERNKILSILAEIENEKVKEFIKAFNTINENFKRIYKELLEKGEAWLELTNKENIFEGGVEIKVKINNKVFNLKALSGGEQSLVALSLIFAIQEFKPGTFYVFDEVDAALDKRNSRKLAKYLKKYSEKTQFIVISHNEEVIVESDYLFGVSMNKKTGISKVVALNLTDKNILEKIKSN